MVGLKIHFYKCKAVGLRYPFDVLLPWDNERHSTIQIALIYYYTSSDEKCEVLHKVLKLLVRLNLNENSACHSQTKERDAKTQELQGSD